MKILIEVRRLTYMAQRYEKEVSVLMAGVYKTAVVKEKSVLAEFCPLFEQKLSGTLKLLLIRTRRKPLSFDRSHSPAYSLQHYDYSPSAYSIKSL